MNITVEATPVEIANMIKVLQIQPTIDANGLFKEIIDKITSEPVVTSKYMKCISEYPDKFAI